MKTKEDKYFDELLDRYFDVFGENYPLDIVSTLSTEEHISRITKAISSGNPVSETETDEDVTY